MRQADTAVWEDMTRIALITEDTMPTEITDLAIGYRCLPAGKLANAVTWMEARAPQPGLRTPWR